MYLTETLLIQMMSDKGPWDYKRCFENFQLPGNLWVNIYHFQGTED